MSSVSVSSGDTTFEAVVDGAPQKWEMGILSTIRKYESALDRLKVEGKSIYTAIDEVIEEVVKAGGPLLNSDQADEFIDLLYQQLALKKKSRGNATAALLQKLQSSTESTPANGTKRSS